MKRKILVVEDSAMNRRILRQILDKEYEVIEAENGQEALSVLHRRYGVVSAVILDILMPVMDGFDVLKAMRGNAVLSQIPVIVATGLADEETEVKALSLGANDFVSKPYNPVLILHCLRNTINLRETASIVNAIQRDKLTGLYNREAFFAKTEAMIREREAGAYVMACFDIDNFKVINDQFGAEEGDRILRYIGKAANECFRSVDGISGRISADNFAALYPATDEAIALVTKAYENELKPRETHLSITYSVGRYVITDLALSGAAIYDRAYLAKQSVKGRYDAHIAYFSEAMRDRLIHEQQIIGEMNAALTGRQFEVWFQPQFNHDTGALIGSEALVRWRHPVKGLIPPDRFIPVFERNGFIYELDKFVWEETCRLLRKWIDAGRSPLSVSVNVSRYDIFRDDFFEQITGLIAKYELPKNLLHLEITESAFAKSSEQIIRIVRRLIDFGLTVEIDDFGSGYSSLNTLKDVPATVLKLDMRFLQATVDSQRGGNILESIVRMAKWLDMSVIAEGVETKEQADYLKTIGCSYIQGFLYARPMPASEYDALAFSTDTEQRLLSLKTVENLNNNAFWDPASMDTLIFNSYVGGACIFEYHNGTIELLRANDQYARVIGSAGMTVEDALKLDWAEHLDADMQENVRVALARSIETGDSVTGEFVFLNLPGCPRETYLRSTMRVIASSGDHYLIYCTNENTTAQRQAEEKERETAEHLQAVMSHIDGGITAAVMEDGALRILLANDKYYEIMGFTRQQYEAEVRSIYDLIHEDDRQRIYELITDAYQNGQNAQMEYRIVRRDGEERWVRAVVSATRFSGVEQAVQLRVFTDITKQKDEERRRQEADDQLRFLNETAHELLAQPDSDEGLVYVLKKLLDYFGGNRAYIFELDRKREIAFNSYEVCADGVMPEKDNLQSIPFETCQFWLHVFDDRSYIDIADVDALDGSRAEERRVLQQQGIRSLIAVPLLRDGALIGFIGIDDPNRRHARIERLAALGDYIAVMLTRRDLAAKIMSDKKTLEGFMNDTPGGFVRMQLYPDKSVKPIYFNDGFYRLVGMTHDELMRLYGEDAFAGVHPDDVQTVYDAVERMLRDGKAYSSKYRLRHGGGGYIWVVIFGRVTQNESGESFLNIYYTDASEQNRLEETREELLDNLPCGAGICEVSGDSVRMVYLNRRYRRYLKRETGNLADVSAFDMVHPDDRQKLREAMLPAFAKGGEGGCDVRIADGNGGYILFRIIGSAMEYRDNKNAIYVTFTPISKEELSYREMLPVALSAVIGASDDCSFVKDRDGRYVCCNRAFLENAGLPEDANVIGKTDFDLIDSSFAQKYQQEDDTVLRDGRALLHYEEINPGKDGSLRYMNTSKYPLLDSAGSVIGIYGVARDITQAREADFQNKLLMESIPGGLATYDCTKDTIRITGFNDGYCRLFGYTREEYEQLSAENPVGRVFPEDLPRLTENVSALVADGTPIACVYRVYVKGGGHKWIDHHGAIASRHGDIVTVNAVLFDVTVRQEATERLRISEEEHRLAMQHSGNIICRYNTVDRSATISPEAAALLSMPERMEDVPSAPVRLGMISPDSTAAYIRFYESILRGEPFGTATFQQKTPGGWRWLDAGFSTIFSSAGAPVSAVISFQDVTEQMEKEAVYRKWQQSLGEKEPASYTLFRCNLSKDASFDTMEGTLLQFDPDPAVTTFNERTREYAEQCVYEEDRDRYIAHLNSDTLLANYYRGKRSETFEYREKRHDVGIRWLRLTIDLVEYPNSRDVEAYLMYENIDDSKRAELLTLERAETDPLTGVLNRATFAARANQILRTSASGAQHALLMMDIDGFKLVNDVFGHGAGDQTLIDVAAAMQSVLRRGDLLGRLGGDEFFVLLRDIPNDAIAVNKAKQICGLTRKAFSMEVQISASIGIAISPRDGTEFDVLYQNADRALYFVKGSGKDSYAFYHEDMDDEHLVPERQTPDDGSAPHKAPKRRMLIVDDSRIDHELLSEIFHEDFLIEKARDGNSALVRLRHYGSAISVVLLDLMMPGMDGFAVLEKMQSSVEMRSIPVLVVSGEDDRATVLRAIRAGAADFINKPVDPDVLRIRVQSAVSKAENERLRAQNSFLELQSSEVAKYRVVLEHTGTVIVEHDWVKGTFTYEPFISTYLDGVWDSRKLWRILLSDMVADAETVEKMQGLMQGIAEDRTRTEGEMRALLKTPSKEKHWFIVHVYKLINAYQLTDRLILTFQDTGGADTPAQKTEG